MELWVNCALTIATWCVTTRASLMDACFAWSRSSLEDYLSTLTGPDPMEISQQRWIRNIALAASRPSKNAAWNKRQKEGWEATTTSTSNQQFARPELLQGTECQALWNEPCRDLSKLAGMQASPDVAVAPLPNHPSTWQTSAGQPSEDPLALCELLDGFIQKVLRDGQAACQTCRVVLASSKIRA